MSFNPPPLPPTQPTWGQFQIWWQAVIDAIKAQETQQDIILAQLLRAISYMPDVPDQTIAADYTGTPAAGELPLTILFQRFTDTTDNTAGATWSFTVDSGALTASFPTPGEFEITGITADSVVTVTSDYGGLQLSHTFNVFLDIAATPQTGSSGGTPSYDTSFASFNTTTHAAVSDELTVIVGASGQVDLSAPLSVSTDHLAPTGTFKVYGKWQWWDAAGPAWVDVAAEVGSSPDCVVSTGPSGFPISSGTLTVNTSKTGLAPAATEKFRLEARNNSGTRTMYLTGTASAVPV